MAVTKSIVTKNNGSGSMILGTGLAFTALILVPALAARIGIGPSLTGAVRIALMKASARACGNGGEDAEAGSVNSISCH